MLRTVTLSLLMLVSVVVMLPFASSTAHGLRQSSASHNSDAIAAIRAPGGDVIAPACECAARLHWRTAMRRLAPYARLTRQQMAMFRLAVTSQAARRLEQPTVANNGEVRFQN